MVARLARAPIPWREFTIVLVIAPLIALIAWTNWARQPAGQAVRTPARIVSATFVPGGKTNSASWSIEVEFAGGKRAFVSLPWQRPDQCRIGGKVDIFVTPARIGKPEMTIDPGACG
jgi:hypothetical protein